MKRLIALAAIFGFSAAVALPNNVLGSPTGYTIVASLTPPTLSSGSSANLNCGWHQECDGTYPFGNGLDWEDGGTNYGNPWYFRGIFATNNPAGGIVATGVPLVNTQDPSLCDKMTVWIVEKFNGVLRAAPIYEHTNITNSAQFSIAGSVLGTYTNRQIGTTIDDHGTNCPFDGSHVHEDHVSVNGSVTISTDTSRYQTGAQCHNNHCGLFANNSPTNWTRRFSWPEGS